jgi:hypothetical protein
LAFHLHEGGWELATSRPTDATSLTPEAVEEKFAGSGVGRKTVTEVASPMNMDTTEINDRLAALKIELKEGKAVTQTAERNDPPPLELLKAILIDGYRPKRTSARGAGNPM